MIKAKFRDYVRSKINVAMKNEVLCKVLCHNICCLVSAMYELGIDPIFSQDAHREVGENRILALTEKCKVSNSAFNL